MDSPSKAFCIFCGASPNGRTREHIIPQWLLKLTGNPKRTAYLGRKWLAEDFAKREYSWSTFTFPACGQCNSKWSSLEGHVKTIVQKILQHADLSASEIYSFLDWLDKVRTGLWLGMYYLNENYRAIIPHFHVNERVGQKDRALLIFESDDDLLGIGLGGIDGPIFHTTPSVFTITINNFHFASISADFLLSARLGWPFAESLSFTDFDTDRLAIEMNPGSCRVSPPVIELLPSISSAVLLQPIGSQLMRLKAPDEFATYYSSQFVREQSINNSQAVGRLLVDNDDPVPYPEEPSGRWRPKNRYPRDILMRDIALWTLRFQRLLYANHPDLSRLTEDQRRQRQSEIASNLNLHDLLIDHVERGGG